MGSPALLTLAIAVVTSALLWFGLWPLAALALVFLVAGRREWYSRAADVVVFAGLASHADPLWVVVLVVGTLASREHDPRAMGILIVASLLATFFSVDWTILTGLLALIAVVRAVRTLVTSGGRPGVLASPRRTSRAP